MKTTVSIIFALAIVSAIASPVKVSSFGFDKNNATKCLQAALDSKHRDLIIDNTGSDWIIDPVILRSDKNIVLDENVVIRARHDGFHGVKDSMFTGKNVSNITISGKKNAAIINENDYFNRKVYSQSEWRHTFSLAGCTNVTIKDLKLQGSGTVYLSGIFHWITDKIRSDFPLEISALRLVFAPAPVRNRLLCL